jgi:ribosomal protein L32
MVRLIPVKQGDRIVWAEDRPKQCAGGHTRLLPSMSPCPECGEPVRSWRCAEDCGAPWQYDDEHVHNSRR